MSTPLFLAAAFVTGLLGLGAALLLFKLLEPLLGLDASNRRLQRRLERRLARGEDRYFEELRSIEASLARNATLAPTGPTLTRMSRWPRILLGPLVITWIGIIALGYLAAPVGLGEPPAWHEHIGWFAIPLLGLSYVLNASDPTTGIPPWASRALGAAVFLFGTWICAAHFLRLPS